MNLSLPGPCRGGFDGQSARYQGHARCAWAVPADPLGPELPKSCEDSEIVGGVRVALFGLASSCWRWQTEWKQAEILFRRGGIRLHEARHAGVDVMSWVRIVS